MKNIKFNTLYILLFTALMVTSCSSEDIDIVAQEEVLSGAQLKFRVPSFKGEYVQIDRLARPIVSIFLVPQGPDSEVFNTTAPSELEPIFQPIILGQIEGLSPAFSNPNDQNVLGQTAAEFASFTANDVLNVSLVEPTVFSTNTLTGRRLEDDIITTELQWIFGGEDLSENPGLSDDHVDANDVPFLSHFPYMAPPFLQ